MCGHLEKSKSYLLALANVKESEAAHDKLQAESEGEPAESEAAHCILLKASNPHCFSELSCWAFPTGVIWRQPGGPWCLHALYKYLS